MIGTEQQWLIGLEIGTSMSKTKGEIPSDKELRAAGFMTTDEFVDKLTRGMREYMRKNWGFFVTDSNLHHPEDLASAALTFAESIFYSIQTFGAGNTNEEE